MIQNLSPEQLEVLLAQLEGLLQVTLGDEVHVMGNGWKFSRRVLIEWVQAQCRVYLQTAVAPLRTATPLCGASRGRR